MIWPSKCSTPTWQHIKRVFPPIDLGYLALDRCGFAGIAVTVMARETDGSIVCIAHNVLEEFELWCRRKVPSKVDRDAECHGDGEHTPLLMTATGPGNGWDRGVDEKGAV